MVGGLGGCLQDDNVALGLSSVFGSVKSTQEADNVVILQRRASQLNRSLPTQGRTEQSIEIRKNRYSGNLGSIPYKFDPRTFLVQVRTFLCFVFVLLTRVREAMRGKRSLSEWDLNAGVGSLRNSQERSSPADGEESPETSTPELSAFSAASESSADSSRLLFLGSGDPSSRSMMNS